MLFGAPSADWEQLTETLEILPDARLWALIYRRPVWPEGAWLRELATRGREETLSDEEQVEVAVLIDEVDRLTLLRARALLVRRQRGHASWKHLKLGA